MKNSNKVTLQPQNNRNYKRECIDVLRKCQREDVVEFLIADFGTLTKEAEISFFDDFDIFDPELCKSLYVTVLHNSRQFGAARSLSLLLSSICRTEAFWDKGSTTERILLLKDSLDACMKAEPMVPLATAEQTISNSIRSVPTSCAALSPLLQALGKEILNALTQRNAARAASGENGNAAEASSSSSSASASSGAVTNVSAYSRVVPAQFFVLWSNLYEFLVSSKAVEVLQQPLTIWQMMMTSPDADTITSSSSSSSTDTASPASVSAAANSSAMAKITLSGALPMYPGLITGDNISRLLGLLKFLCAATSLVDRVASWEVSLSEDAAAAMPSSLAGSAATVITRMWRETITMLNQIETNCDAENNNSAAMETASSSSSSSSSLPVMDTDQQQQQQKKNLPAQHRHARCLLLDTACFFKQFCKVSAMKGLSAAVMRNHEQCLRRFEEYVWILQLVRNISVATNDEVMVIVRVLCSYCDVL